LFVVLIINQFTSIPDKFNLFFPFLKIMKPHLCGLSTKKKNW